MVSGYVDDADMIIIRLMGGLGNQMQQYALCQKFISMGREVYLDTTMYSDNDYRGTIRELQIGRFPGVDIQVATDEQIEALRSDGSLFKRIRNRISPGASGYVHESGMFMPEILDRDDIYLDGYWSAEKYYADIMPKLREIYDFTSILPTKEDNPALADMIQRISAESYSVSVHIRRGDYLKPENAAFFGGISTDEYYESAFAYVRENHPGAVFFIFSDDPGYVRDRYGEDTTCVAVDVNHDDNNMFDIYLMSLCDAHICANSSFSFWGARLDAHRDSALCIRPTIHAASQEFDPDVMRDLWKNWIFIDPQGNVR